MSVYIKNRLIFTIALYLILNYHKTLAVPLPCRNFTDTRTTKFTDGDLTKIIIPPHLTHDRKEEYTYHFLPSYGTESGKKCDISEIFQISLVSPKSGLLGVSRKKYFFQDQWKFANETYFTDDFYIHHNSHFLSLHDYCVLSISDTEMVIKTCKLNCSSDLSKTYLYKSRNIEYHDPSRVCIPKCCAIDETLSLTDGTCRKLDRMEPTYFIPYLHLQVPSWFLLENPNNPNLIKDPKKVLVSPTLNSFSGGIRTLNSTHGFGESESFTSIWDQLHFFRSGVNCSKYIWKETFLEDRGYDVTLIWDHGKEWEEKRKRDRWPLKRYNFRLEVNSGRVKLAFLTRSRKWIGYRKEFCVDGLDNWGGEMMNRSVNQVVVMCIDDEIDAKKYTGEEVVVGDEDKYAWPGKYFHLAVLIFCTILLLVGLWMYWLVGNKLNLNGKLITCHLGTVAISYLLRCIALPAEERNAEIVVSSDFEESRRIGWFCVGIAVLCHYTYLASFYWLSVMSGICRRFWFNCIFGWGFPAILVTIFCVVDNLFNDPWSEAVVPDYAVESCGVASWSDGYYTHVPVCVFIGLSFLYILAKLIPKIGRVCSGEEGNHTKDDTIGSIGQVGRGIPFRLFATIWCAQTIAWIITVTEWIRAYNEQEYNWARTFLLIIGNLLETFILFHIYCMNEALLGLVGKRIPGGQETQKFLKRNHLIWEGNGLPGLICVDDSVDTIAIEGEEIRTNIELTSAK